jgi:L-tyrosine isonitrile synthase
LGGKEFFKNQAKYFIERGLPIYFCLPAFPFKSNNSHKVLGILPDKGEILAFEALNSFLSTVNSAYKPGAILSVVSDGRVFSDLFKISDENVSLYSEDLKGQYSSSNITFTDLSDFLP